MRRTPVGSPCVLPHQRLRWPVQGTRGTGRSVLVRNIPSRGSVGLEVGLLMITGNGKVSVPRSGKSQNTRGTPGPSGRIRTPPSVRSIGMAIVVKSLLRLRSQDRRTLQGRRRSRKGFAPRRLPLGRRGLAGSTDGSGTRHPLCLKVTRIRVLLVWFDAHSDLAPDIHVLGILDQLPDPTFRCCGRCLNSGAELRHFLMDFRRDVTVVGLLL
jgi:hypothetical protein